MSALPKSLTAFRNMVAAIDADVRAIVPKCAACGRPDGGVIPGGCTPYEAGLVDRQRCPNPNCPMREAV